MTLSELVYSGNIVLSFLKYDVFPTCAYTATYSIKLFSSTAVFAQSMCTFLVECMTFSELVYSGNIVLSFLKYNVFSAPCITRECIIPID